MRPSVSLSMAVTAAAFLSLVCGIGAAQEMHWYRGSTHTHTGNSHDAKAPPLAVALWYRERGYNFIFLTDHEHTDHPGVTDVGPVNAAAAEDGWFLVLPGQEITQSKLGASAAEGAGAAHVNALFTSKVIWGIGEHACKGCGAQAAASVPLTELYRLNTRAIAGQGGIAQINHPNSYWNVRPENLRDVPQRSLLEIWNTWGGHNNLGGDDGQGHLLPSAEGLWDILLSRGQIIWGVSTDDNHNIGGGGLKPDGTMPELGWIMLQAPALTPEAVKDALLQGRFYATTGVTLSAITAGDTSLALTIEPPAASRARYRTRFIGRDGRLLAEVPGFSPVYRFKGDEGYVRAAVTDSNGRQAWTQPVFLDGRGRGMQPRALPLPAPSRQP